MSYAMADAPFQINDVPWVPNEILVSFRATPIMQLPYDIVYKLQNCINANIDVIRKIAAVITYSRWTESDIATILRSENPSERFLQELGIQNHSLEDLIIYMKQVQFWPGLSLFFQNFGPLLLRPLPGRKTLLPEECLQLSCDAAAIPPPTYKWFFLNNGIPSEIPNQTKATLVVQNPSMLNNKPIICSVANKYRQIFTNPCLVEVLSDHLRIRPAPDPPRQERISPPPLTQFKAKDKVALLIGNCHYMAEKKLTAPGNDVLQIGEKLTKMGFKTLICKDMTKAHMENVINFFISLLSEGVYGVFYFAGHGFELRCVCYLVPVDAPTKPCQRSCISSREIVNRILEKSPALCLVVLDMCRVSRDQVIECIKDEPAPHTSNSHMIVYATSEGRRAYELSRGRKDVSLFAQQLLKHIDEKVSLTKLVMEKVLPSICEDPIAQANNQIPEVRTSMAYPRSLWDEIDSRGATQVFERTRQDWINATRCPERKHFPVPSLGVTVRMMFASDFSNTLTIYTACVKAIPNVAYKAGAWINRINMTTNVEASRLIDRETWPLGLNNNRDCLSVYKTDINGLENLKEDLIVSIVVKGSVAETQEETTTDLYGINLGQPLLAAVIGRRQPVVHEEETATENDESVYVHRSRSSNSLFT